MGNQRVETKGLTTAASIWLTAAIGVAAGMGRESTAVLSTLLALLILSVIPMVERLLGKDGSKTEVRRVDDAVNK